MHKFITIKSNLYLNKNTPVGIARICVRTEFRWLLYREYIMTVPEHISLNFE